MNEEDLKKMITKEKIASEIIMHATPIDFDQLIKDGVIKQIGKSDYTDNMQKLPYHVAQKIKSVGETKNGLKLTFYKETKSIKKSAEKLMKLGYTRLHEG